MKNSLVVAALLLTQVQAIAAPDSNVWRNEKVLGENSVRAEVETDTLACYNGKSPSDRGFPYYATIVLKKSDLKFKTASGFEYKGWDGSNVQSYSTQLVGIYDCKDIPQELKPGQTLAVKGAQVLWEVVQKRGDGKCQKHLIEDAVINLGNHQVRGSAQMIVFPIDLKNCE